MDIQIQKIDRKLKQIYTEKKIKSVGISGIRFDGVTYAFCKQTKYRGDYVMIRYKYGERHPQKILICTDDDRILCFARRIYATELQLLSL